MRQKGDNDMRSKFVSYAMSFTIGAGLGAVALLPCIMRIIENVMR